MRCVCVLVVSEMAKSETTNAPTTRAIFCLIETKKARSDEETVHKPNLSDPLGSAIDCRRETKHPYRRNICGIAEKSNLALDGVQTVPDRL